LAKPPCYTGFQLPNIPCSLCPQYRLLGPSYKHGFARKELGISSPDLGSRPTANFRQRIVRDSADKALKPSRHPVPYDTPTSGSRPLSPPNKKSSLENGGGIQRSRDARAVGGSSGPENRPFSALIQDLNGHPVETPSSKAEDPYDFPTDPSPDPASISQKRPLSPPNSDSSRPRGVLAIASRDAIAVSPRFSALF